MLYMCYNERTGDSMKKSKLNSILVMVGLASLFVINPVLGFLAVVLLLVSDK